MQAIANRPGAGSAPAGDSHLVRLSLAYERLATAFARPGCNLLLTPGRVPQLDRGEINVIEAAAELGVSRTWARKLLANHRHGGKTPSSFELQRLNGSTIPTLRHPDQASVREPSKPTSGTEGSSVGASPHRQRMAVDQYRPQPAEASS